ncbi:uroporphyrinogen decarboxylase [Thermoactinomyces vulgaris]|uniref:Uroporphyrinogen decarboxylase n=1 Tax=Thermoactinomyces vulgaris TaxID=2026 RepID=A0ABS0QJQ0_THEVU|nr:uroporphyrinogen decarboxylase [Thermoactinomyces vulgaris]MBA4552259.1 uroporphyrinogen decarboxylase [Thermoactinomyces vulgaris]MBA4597533.1 uroporphyrinogen decarboxylase [Thermoactinomyces vulgaris]MBH8589203.1 uroporphyrinogen decarboxylase [Thermoactinomyces vulgaris]RMB00186.1 uroporphyrinogen decarboxylase [Thermoactinomyces vulgaris]
MGQMNDVFLRACRKEDTPYVPVWYMRQAGRYQPEYREIRRKYSFFEMSENPEVCAKVTSLPVEQLGVDAAILFADIMTPLKHIGVEVAIQPGTGPVISNPVRGEEEIGRLGELDPEKHVPYILEAVQILNEQLSVPLIGFAGAPFTLASYMVEGGPSKNYHKTKALMYSAPSAWDQLMAKLGDMTVNYLKGQIEAGAHAVQVFDSWVGALNQQDYQTYVAPVMERIFRKLKEETDVPVIYFGVGAGHLLEAWNQLPVDVIGLDWRTPIRFAREQGVEKALQGNLDPSILMGPWELIEERTKEILDQGMKQPGYIFNLGHGVFPDVRVETLQKLTEFVHQYTRR